MFHEWAQQTSEIFFQHEKRNFASPSGHVMFIHYINTNEIPNHFILKVFWCERRDYILYSDVVKGEPRPTGRGRRRSRDEKCNQGVGDFRFTNILQLFLFISSFSITFLYHFFSIPFSTHDIYPHPRPHPRPTTFSYTQSKAFCSSGNLEQVLHFWATFGQNIGLCQAREKWAVW